MPIVRGTDHLTHLLDDVAPYHNDWRGHMTLGGAPPAIIHRREGWEKPEPLRKQIRGAIEQRTFTDTRVTASRPAA